MFCVRMLAVLAEGSPEHKIAGEQTRALAGFNGLLWRGGVVSSVGAGCGFRGGVLEKAGRKHSDTGPRRSFASPDKTFEATIESFNDPEPVKKQKTLKCNSNRNRVT